MNVQVTVRDDSATRAVKKYAEEKAQKLPRNFNVIQKVDVILSQEGSQHRAEVILSIAKGETIVCHVDDEHFNAAVDGAVQKAETAVRRYKSRVRDHQASPPPVASDNEPDENLETYQDVVDKTEFPG